MPSATWSLGRVLRAFAQAPVTSRRAAVTTVLVWVALAALLPAVAPRLASVQDNRTVNDPPASSDSVKARGLLAEAFPDRRGTPAIVVIQAPERLGATGDAEARRITSALTGPHRPAGIGPPVSHLTAPDGRRTLLSPDGTTAQILVPILGSSSEDAFGRTVDAVRRVAGTGHGPIQIRVTGPAAIARDTVKAFGSANLALLAGTVGLVLCLLLAIYRSPVLALLPLVAVGVAVQVTNAVGAALVSAGAFAVSSQAATIMTVLLFGVGTDACLFIVSRYREQLTTTEDRYEAMRAAMRRLAEPLVSSAATIVLALLALLLATLPALRGFGPFLALAVAILYLCALTFVPAAVCLLGPAALWPKRTATASGARGWARIAEGVIRRPAVVIAATGAVLVVLSLGLLGYRESYDFISGFRVATDSGRGAQMLKRALGPGALAPTTMLVESQGPLPDGGSGALVPLRRAIAAQPGVQSVGRATLSPNGDVARLDVVYRGNPYASAALDLTAHLRALAPAAVRAGGIPRARVLIAGDSATSLDLRTANDHDLGVIAPVTIAIIAIVLALLLRSLIAPLYLIATILASFAATLGLTVFCLVTLAGDEGIGVRVKIYIFVFLITLGVDYNILLTSRLREEARRNGPVEGVRRALTHTGGVITSAGLILAGTFAVLMTQPIRELFQFGFAMATGLLLDTFLVRGLLVPAIARVLGARNWWPSKVPRTDSPRQPVSAAHHP